MGFGQWCNSPPPASADSVAPHRRREIYRDLDPKAAPWVAPTVQMKQLKASELGESLTGLWVRESDDRVRSK